MDQIPEHNINLTMRTPHEVMPLARLGCHYPSRLSFMRVLTRRLLSEHWHIERSHFNLDDNGVGEILYTVRTSDRSFTFVAFTHAISDDKRTDRVIADRWDMTATLCAGEVNQEHLELLKANVPKQEAGRLDSRSLVLTRANKSSRNFNYVVDQLAKGKQPEVDAIAKVGYLYRTTAVYGSGKFGMCDWSQVQRQHSDFARPFAAEMFTCFMLRQASFDVAEHMAQRQAPSTAVRLDPDTKRYFGIGNATGLGMAPFLICHPILIDQWIECRETALARVRVHGTVSKLYQSKLARLLQRAQQHLLEIDSSNEPQNAINHQAAADLGKLVLTVQGDNYASWDHVLESAFALSSDTQEILFSCLVEMYPELVDDLADSAHADETFTISPEQPLQTLKSALEQHYDWALNIDFDDPDSQAIFWYRSAEKMEPRLGRTYIDEGADRQLHVDVARQAYELYEYTRDHLDRNPADLVAHFLICFPALRYIVSRVQTMSARSYGEIQANLLDVDIAPTELMRCKLAFFGVSKFDPQSRLWVRNTMFQGAPTLEDIDTANDIASVVNLNELQTTREAKFDDWSFPLMPTSQNATVE